MIRLAGYGGARGLPSKADLDNLHLSSATRAKVLRACTDVAALNEEGTREQAWAAADEASAAIIEELPLDEQDPDYLKAEDLSTLGPLELADRVKARGPGRIA
ncbi:MAG TPA: hypothetical protein VJ716_04580 [Gaiellaceae bacterium]|nr:hypothetical protein [Gaiellaceae bacterium]